MNRDFEAITLKCPTCRANKARLMKVQRYMTDDAIKNVKRLMTHVNAIVCSSCKAVHYYRGGDILIAPPVLSRPIMVRRDSALRQPDLADFAITKHCLEFGEIRRDL